MGFNIHFRYSLDVRHDKVHTFTKAFRRNFSQSNFYTALSYPDNNNRVTEQYCYHKQYQNCNHTCYTIFVHVFYLFSCICNITLKFIYKIIERIYTRNFFIINPGFDINHVIIFCFLFRCMPVHFREICFAPRILFCVYNKRRTENQHQNDNDKNKIKQIAQYATFYKRR